MCGITGRVQFDQSTVDRSLIEAMCQKLSHRGPDDQGVFVAPGIGLGQRRLAIIDLRASANPPLSNEDDTVWVILNGEIYNYQALKADLIANGHRFRTETDTEIIPHLYEQYGTDCLQRMRGMFAFALWDSRRRLLFAGRDRLGKKPFFYAHNGRSLTFGSEIKAITAAPDVSVIPNYAAIDSFLTHHYLPSPLTAFEGIHRLGPGHFLVCQADGSLHVQQYWNPPVSEKTTAPQEEVESRLLELLRESVRLRMVADVPLGAFLSGGIDSTAVVAMMAQESGRPVKTFSIGFEEDGYNELPYARLVAERYGTDHSELVVRPNMAEVLPLLVYHFNEPFADPSALPAYYVSKLARQQVTVALNGDGGDESFAGYEHYWWVLKWGALDGLPSSLRRLVCSAASNGLGHLPYANSVARWQRGLTMLGSEVPERYQLQMTLLKPQEKQVAYSREFRSLIAERPLTALAPMADTPGAGSLEPLDWMMRHDQMYHLPDCLMSKTDIASMTNSLEVRSPFLDHELVEYASTIPARMKYDGHRGKKILREAVRGLLPPEILSKPKTGFGVPLEKWLRGDLFDMLRSVVLDDRALKRGLFNPGFVKRMVEEQREQKRDWGDRLWALLFLEMWFREFID